MHFREATFADKARILALRARCFADDDPDKLDPRFWDWEFGTHARVFIGEETGEIQTHLAITRNLAVDAMTAPGARGKGAFTGVARFATTHSNHDTATAYQIRGAVLGSMLRAGWTVAEKVPVLLRPLFGNGASQHAQLQRSDAEWMSELSGRARDFIEWRFFDNPIWQYDITGADHDAYLVARKTKLKGIDTYAIVDLAWREQSAAKRLLRDAIERAKAERCTVAAAFVSRQHPAFWMFVSRGFVPGPHWFRLLVHPPEAAQRRWEVMWADTDHL